MGRLEQDLRGNWISRVMSTRSILYCLEWELSYTFRVFSYFLPCIKKKGRYDVCGDVVGWVGIPGYGKVGVDTVQVIKDTGQRQTYSGCKVDSC